MLCSVPLALGPWPLCCKHLGTRGGDDIVTLTPDLQDGAGSENAAHGRPAHNLEVIGRRPVHGTCLACASQVCALARETRYHPASQLCPALSCKPGCSCWVLVLGAAQACQVPGPQPAGHARWTWAQLVLLVREGGREGGRGAWKSGSLFPCTRGPGQMLIRSCRDGIWTEGAPALGRRPASPAWRHRPAPAISSFFCHPSNPHPH